MHPGGILSVQWEEVVPLHRAGLSIPDLSARIQPSSPLLKVEFHHLPACAFLGTGRHSTAGVILKKTIRIPSSV